jgi:hypothetical protein
MSQTLEEAGVESVSGTSRPVLALPDPTDQPIPIWPEGALALAAGIVLAAIAFRHRKYIGRKALDVQRMAQEFQRQGGIDDLQAIARQATELFKGA